MSGFSNPIIGGGGSLVYPSIHSPNFVQSPLTGWSIDKDGNAFFANVTITGSFSGTNYVINSAGAFFYSGIPALGNLVASITNAAGTDSHGNAYPAGAAFGVAGTGQTNLDTSGNFLVSGADGNNVIRINPNLQRMVIYSDPPGAGAVLVSLAAKASTDAFSNSIPQGIQVNAGTITIGPSTGPQVIIEEVSSIGKILLPTHATFENQVANISSEANGSGAAAFAQLDISGPSTTTTGANDFVGIELNSANEGNTSDANMEFVYTDNGGTGHEYAFMDSTGFNILGAVVQGTEPGSSPASAATWHSRTSGFATGVSSGRFNYMYLPIGGGSGAIAVDWSFNFSSGPTDGTNILSAGGAAINASFRPLDDKYLPGWTDLQRVESGSNNRTAALHIGTGGSVFFQGIAGGASQFTGQGIYFLNI